MRPWKEKKRNMDNKSWVIYNNLIENRKIAEIEFNSENNEYSLTTYTPNIFELPLLLQNKESLTSKDLENFLKSRVLPIGRYGVSDQLGRFGIKEYDWQEMIKMNLGRVLTDTFYILTDGENSLSDFENRVFGEISTSIKKVELQEREEIKEIEELL